MSLVDQFITEDITLDLGSLLCNPADVEFRGIPLPEDHLTCYPIVGSIGVDTTNTLDDQFGTHTNVFAGSGDLLCVPSLVPEPGVLLSLGPGLMLLAWLDRRRKRRGA